MRGYAIKYKVTIVAGLLIVATVIGMALVNIGLLRDQRWQFLLLAGLLIVGLVLASGRPGITTAFVFIFSMTTQVGMNIPQGPAWHHGGAADVFQIFIFDVIFVPLGGMWVVQWLSERKRRLRLDLVDMVPLAFVVWSSITIVLSVSPYHSLFQIYLMLKVYFFYLFVKHWVDNWRKVETVSLALAAGLIFQSLLIFAQFILQENIGLMGPMEDRPVWLGQQIFNRPGGTVGSDQVVGSYLGLLLPIALAGLLVTLPYWQGLLYGVAFVVGQIALVMTLSRAGWIQFGAALLLFGLIFFKRVGFRMWALTLVIGWTTVLILMELTVIGDLVKMRVLEFDPITTFGRLELAKVAWNMIEANPIFGVGLNTFRFVAPQYDTTGITFVVQAAVHNIPLLVWAETGTVGLLLFLAFPLLVCWRLWDYQRHSGGPSTAFTAAILVGLIGFFVGGLMDSNYANQLNIVHFWVVSGLGMAITRLGTKKFPFPSVADNDHILGIV